MYQGCSFTEPIEELHNLHCTVNAAVPLQHQMDQYHEAHLVGQVYIRRKKEIETTSPYVRISQVAMPCQKKLL